MPCVIGSHWMMVAGLGSAWVMGWRGRASGTMSSLCKSRQSESEVRIKAMASSFDVLMASDEWFIDFCRVDSRFCEGTPPPYRCCDCLHFETMSRSRETKTVVSGIGTTSSSRTSTGVLGTGGRNWPDDDGRSAVRECRQRAWLGTLIVFVGAVSVSEAGSRRHGTMIHGADCRVEECAAIGVFRVTATNVPSGRD